MNPSTETDVMTARSTSMVLMMLTILLTCCWMIVDDSRLQGATFVTGLIAVVTWLSYCQQKTSAEVAACVAKNQSR